MAETPAPYLLALRQARSLEGRLSVGGYATILQQVDAYILSLEALRLRPGASVRRIDVTLQAVRLQADILRNIALTDFGGVRVLTAEQTIALYEVANRQIVQSFGGGQVFGLRALPVTLLTAYENIGGAGNWQTLLSGYWGDMVTESNAIMRAGLVHGIGADEMARRLRFYVEGSQDFRSLFEDQVIDGIEVKKLDLRRLSKAQRGGARNMLVNSRRVAFSELHNVRRISEIAHFERDPLIAGVRWTLSPDRGTGGPDECDVLASSDLYGLGPGVYPLDAVPAPPHPYDRCELIPVTRSSSELGAMKPSGSAGPDLSKISIPVGVSTERGDGIRENALGAIRAVPTRSAA